MPTHWNGYAYDSPSASQVRHTRRDRRCCHCHGLIYKGEEYDNWNGYIGYAQHYPECPKDKAERERRGCEKIGG
jgi:hypothetical protein